MVIKFETNSVLTPTTGTQGTEGTEGVKKNNGGKNNTGAGQTGTVTVKTDENTLQGFSPTDDDDTTTDETKGKSNTTTATGTQGTTSTQASESINKIEVQAKETEDTYNKKIDECYDQIELIKDQIEQIELSKRTLLSQMRGEDTDISSIMSSIRQCNDDKITLYNNIQTVLTNISTLQQSIEENRAAAKSAVQNIQSLAAQMPGLSATQSSGAYTPVNLDANADLGATIAAIGNSFVGAINSDAAGNAEFSPGGASQAWCADFATSIVKRAFQAKGMQVPAGFGSSAVNGLQSWGQSNGRYIQIAGKPNKAEIIVNMIRPGDLIIQKENGSSHTGIVTKVYPDGSYDTVEGNTSNAVKNRHYTANEARLSGFVKMT